MLCVGPEDFCASFRADGTRNGGRLPFGRLGRFVYLVDRREREMLFGLVGGRRWRRPTLDAGWRRRHGRRSVVRLKGVLAIDGHLFGGETRRVPADLRARPVLLEPALGVPPGQQLQPWTGRPEKGTVNASGIAIIGQCGASDLKKGDLWLLFVWKGSRKNDGKKTWLSIAWWYSDDLFLFALITFLSIVYKHSVQNKWINEQIKKKKKRNKIMNNLCRGPYANQGCLVYLFSHLATVLVNVSCATRSLPTCRAELRLLGLSPCTELLLCAYVQNNVQGLLS